jgi:predicted transcriptional regulator
MASAKEQIKRMLDELPDDASWEDLQHSIYVRERIERGRREALEGRVVDQEEIERRMSQWLVE